MVSEHKPFITRWHKFRTIKNILKNTRPIWEDNQRQLPDAVMQPVFICEEISVTRCEPALVGYTKYTFDKRSFQIIIPLTEKLWKSINVRRRGGRERSSKKRRARTNLDFHFTRNCEQLTVHNDIALNYINQSGQSRAFGESVIYVDLIHIAHWIWESLPIASRIKGVDDEASIPVLSRKEKTYFFKKRFQWNCYELYKMLAVKCYY